MVAKTIEAAEKRSIWVNVSDERVMLDSTSPKGDVCVDLTPEQAYELVDFITENVKRPEPPKFVPEDGIYVNKGFPLSSKIYKYRNDAWRNPEGYVIAGRQDELSARAKSGDLVRLVKEGGN